ncbi:peptidoglycan-binding domain-containing protein [Promicromonospora sp. NPDC050880]|uniref:peptidoglycan-binding domain-containing protein n=1 Tax=Promicromonospora sp. NPDC050880 TaxID=3364406 RepID=UPI00379028E6
MTVATATRARWGARYSDGDLDLHTPALEVFVHHSVTPTLSPSASIEEECAQMRALESIGQSRFGTGISYNAIVFPSGRPYQGVSWDRRGTHTGGRNSTVRSICFAGNFETNRPTDAALATASQIYHGGKGDLWIASAPLRGHRDVSQTACPGKNLYAKLGVIRSGELLDDRPTTPAAPSKPAKPGLLVVDGAWGTATTRRLQQELGTPVDGVVSSQPAVWRATSPGLTTGWDWDATPNGSRMISELQELLRVDRDGKIGPQTISALQRRLGTAVDGVISRESRAVMALQHRLNAGRI